MTLDVNPSSPLGVFDSGVGGLSVLKAVHQVLPDESTIYLADQAHVPYGRRPLEEVQSYAEAISSYLLSKGVKLIVVACNTATAAAVPVLRQTMPVPIVGMEPAV
ncbi:MAG: glutamate racemase, partial [Anaerolineales bacterium]